MARNYIVVARDYGYLLLQLLTFRLILQTDIFFLESFGGLATKAYLTSLRIMFFDPIIALAFIPITVAGIAKLKNLTLKRNIEISKFVNFAAIISLACTAFCLLFYDLILRYQFNTLPQELQGLIRLSLRYLTLSIPFRMIQLVLGTCLLTVGHGRVVLWVQCIEFLGNIILNYVLGTIWGFEFTGILMSTLLISLIKCGALVIIALRMRLYTWQIPDQPWIKSLLPSFLKEFGRIAAEKSAAVVSTLLILAKFTPSAAMKGFLVSEEILWFLMIPFIAMLRIVTIHPENFSKKAFVHILILVGIAGVGMPLVVETIVGRFYQLSKLEMAWITSMLATLWMLFPLMFVDAFIRAKIYLNRKEGQLLKTDLIGNFAVYIPMVALSIYFQSMTLVWFAWIGKTTLAIGLNADHRRIRVLKAQSAAL